MRKVCLVLCIIFTFCLSAQEALIERYRMDAIDLSAGLPHNHVNQIFSDSRGFIWISTYGGGIVRYDGFSFLSPTLSDSQGLRSNSCKSITEDGFQRLWIAFDEGTRVLDLRTMNRIIPRYNTQDIRRLLDIPSVKTYCDAKGALWQVTRDSVFRYTFKEDGTVSHISSYHYVGNTPDVTVCDVDHNGTVWICMDGGLYRLAEIGGELVREEISPVLRQLYGFFVTSLMKRGNKIWISTNQGLYAYDQYIHTVQSWRHTGDLLHGLSHDHVTALASASDGRLLIGTLKGVDVLDEHTGTFVHWNSASSRPLSSDFVLCMMAHDGQLWIGTETSGIVKLSPLPLLVRNYQHHPTDATSLSPHPVNAIYVEPNGTLWAGTVEGGLNRKAVGNNAFTHFTTQNSPLSHNSVSVIEPDAHGHLWVGTWGGGLNIVTLSDQTLRHVSLPDSMVTQTNYIGSLAYDKYNDALWIGSNDGVFYLDLKTGQLSDPFVENRFIRGCIGTHIDKDGQLWMGCLSGVVTINLKAPRTEGKFQYRHFRNKLDHPESSIIDKITCFCESKDGTLWLGSNGYGIYHRVIDKAGKEIFEAFTTDDGLANNAVKGIVEDTQGRLWITTDNGLSVYDIRARSFINYTEREGLGCQRYYFNSAVIGSDGTIYLGSLNGLTEIHGENTETHYPIHLTFTRLTVDNQVVTALNNNFLDADISQAKRINLHESNKSFAIDFSALTYAGEVLGHYSYRLKGFEDDWIRLKPGEHSARYTSLKPGNYTFEVKYSTEMNEIEEHVISIAIEVMPYFWRSWWFNLLLMAALVASTVWFYRYKEREWKRLEAEKLLTPIRKVLEEAEEPQQLQSRIQNILDNHEKLRVSFHKSVEADKQEVMLHSKSFMDHAMEILEQDYMKSEFGVSEFAEAMGMSKPLLSKRLNAEAGMSTGQFIRNYRLTIAKRLLLENYANRNITEIAYKVGFNDPKYFTRCFTNQYGCSPSNYIGDI